MGLEGMIDGEEVHFIGKTSRVKQREKGTKWFFVGPKIGANILAEGAIMYHDQKTEVGVITGAIWSPSLKRTSLWRNF